MDLNKLYQDHHKLIKSVAYNFGNGTILDPTDLINLGDEVFLRCAKRWTSERGMFSTMLQTSLLNAFRKELKRARRREIAEAGYTAQMAEGHTTIQDDTWLGFFSEGLSEDAKSVIDLLLHGDLDTNGLAETRYTIRKAISSNLKKRRRGTGPGRRWYHQRVMAAFAAIEKRLAEV